MDIDLNNLGIFAKIAPAAGTSGTEVVNLTKNDQISSGGAYKAGDLLGRWFRDAPSRQDNNIARTKLLQALGNTLNIGGMVTGENGKVTFSLDFMKVLEAKLGSKVLETGDFKVKDGEVTSGRPLTERRVRAIVDRVRELAAADNEAVVGSGERMSIADLQAEQAEQLLRQTHHAGHNLGIFSDAVCALLGMPMGDIALEEFQQFRLAVGVAFHSCQADSADAAKFDAALECLNALRSPGRDPITVQSLEQKAKELRVARADAVFKTMSSIGQLKYAKTEKGQEFLAAKHEVRPNSKTTKWLQSLIDQRAIKGFIEDVMPQVKGTRQRRFMEFCVNRLDPKADHFNLVSQLLACRFNHVDDQLPKHHGEFKASEVWAAIFDEPVPEGIDGLDAKACTAKFYKAFGTQLATAMKARGADSTDKDFNGRLDMGLLVMANNICTQHLPFDCALKVQAGQFDAIKFEDLKGKVLYDPAAAKQLGTKGLNDQWNADFRRCGLRMDFQQVGSLRISKQECQAIKDGPQIPGQFLENFNEFTTGMSEEQKLVVGFGLTQAGIELHGSLFGDGGAGIAVYDLSKDSNDNVLLKVTVPPMPKSGVDQVSYTYQIKPDGTNELTSFTYGEPKAVQS